MEIMRDCIQLKIPNKVDGEVGKNWGEITNYLEYFNEKN